MMAPWVEKYGLRQPYGKCQCGCGQDAPLAEQSDPKRGVIIREPIIYIQCHHIPNFGVLQGLSTEDRRKVVEELFWAKVDKRSPDECWQWLGRISPQGYGTFSDGKGGRQAHAFSYELHTGQSIGKLFACHKCDNRSCVNPNHIFAGTQLDNVKDMISKGRQRTVAPVGEKSGAAKLTEKAVVEICELLAQGQGCLAIGRMYGVSEGTIHHIREGKTWKHVPRPDAHLMQRDGRKTLTRAECEALAGHPGLAESQKREFAAMAESVNWTVQL